MDYIFNLDSLQNKSTELNSMKTSVTQVTDEISSGYLNSVSGSEIGTLINKIKQSSDRLKKGYNNSYSWLSRYVNEMNSLENSLSSFSSSVKVTAFKGEFIDIFSKKAMPLLNSNFDWGDQEFEGLAYGSFEWHTFRASNGVEIGYYLYLPDEIPEGLPVMIYMHGGSSYGNSSSGMTSHGLTNKIYTHEVTPQGIVICPFIRNFEGDNIQVGLRELADSVVSEYSANPDRVSASGHSYGAITAYRMVEANPGYFSAIVPISGWGKITDAFETTPVWAFHGSNDDRGYGQTTYSGAVKAVNTINAMGGTAVMHTFQGAGHGYVQDYTYSDEYDSPDGEHETVLKWAFRQNRQKNQSKQIDV